MDPFLEPTNATLMSHVTNALLVVDEEKALVLIALIFQRQCSLSVSAVTVRQMKVYAR